MKRFNSSDSRSNGNGFAGTLFLLFLGLRLAGLIQWPWVWVFAPMWIPLTLATVYVIVKRLLRK